MTAIVGIANKGVVYIGGDSAGVDPSNLAINMRKDEKVFVRDKFVFGFTSSFRMGQVLSYSFKPPYHRKSLSIEQYMNTIFIDKVRECFGECGVLKVVSDVESFDGAFLVGYCGRLFKIGCDFQVEESIDDFNACGCGEDVCIGALWATQCLEPEERVNIALSAAARYNAGVREPFTIKSVGVV